MGGNGRLIVEKERDLSVEGKEFFAVLDFLGIKYVPTYLLMPAMSANMGKSSASGFSSGIGIMVRDLVGKE